MKLCGHDILCPTFQVPDENTSIVQKPPLLAGVGGGGGGGWIIEMAFLPAVMPVELVGNSEEKITDKPPTVLRTEGY